MFDSEGLWAFIDSNELFGFKLGFILRFNYFKPSFIVVPIILSLMPDYISLLETRYILRFMSKKRSISRIVSFLIVDIALTALISGAALSIYLQLWLIATYTNTNRISFRQINIDQHIINVITWTPLIIKSAATFKGGVAGPPPPWIFFYCTFMTSIWMWLYGAAGILIFAAQRFDIGLRYIRRWMNIRQYPMRAIAVAICIILMVGILVSAITLAIIGLIT
jgi:hypothetical protein